MKHGGGGGKRKNQEVERIKKSEFLDRLEKIYTEVKKSLKSIDCPECGDYLMVGATVCSRYEDDETGETQKVGCGKSIISDIQSKLLKIKGNYITYDGKLNPKSDTVGIVEYNGRFYTLKEIFLLINYYDKELMDTKIMEDVNNYLKGHDDFGDLCERTFKNMQASTKPAKLRYYNITMSELGKLFGDSYHSPQQGYDDYESGDSIYDEETDDEGAINQIIDEDPMQRQGADIAPSPEIHSQNIF